MQYQTDGERFTCEDFALSTLVVFVFENGLPISISNGTGIYNSRDNRWNDVVSLKKMTTIKLGDFLGIRQGYLKNEFWAGRYGSLFYGGQPINATEACGRNFRWRNFGDM
jgi:hypothetical protein